ncbi:diguanylate cyclase (GGDEF) domain-containing protein [Rhodoferax sp. OV413]|uniref:putative bifunctional diguanylate cyclase/phosphodiesterase n=1 Tax=Rhodoferax sp. OV413 TaxID=1855285 RepID=UPI000889258E|nr:bifunctional diguanylate cyclase/phosphodiesterase [Rhodoferax sp. OV413]SDP88028.1 diguanylate cyclase (GGDEF) domain-containing protein [Rhodoferax sp. OV413]
MSNTDLYTASDYEALLQFLYLVPVGLVQTTLGGEVLLLNAMSARLLLPVSPDGSLDNLFTALADVAPDLRALAQAFTQPYGVVCESLRIPLQPHPGQPALGAAQPQVLSFSLFKLDPTRLMAVLNDATFDVQREQQGLARRLNAAARVDNLTRMPNRSVALEHLQRILARNVGATGDAGPEFAVLFMNCDRLKQINDTAGHAAGDGVLGLLADRLRATLRSRSRFERHNGSELVAARIGGDEFVVLVDDLARADHVHAVAQRLLDVLAKPYGIGPHQLHCSVSMGIVLRAQARGDADAVLQSASIAMVEAKRAGGARYVVFEPAMQVRAAHRADIEAELRRALAQEQLFVVYQPVVGLVPAAPADGAVDRTSGVEALVRWDHPARGVVLPYEFITVAEECGLIGALGDFVLASACRQFVQWRAALGPQAPRLLAVNVSRAQLHQPGWVAYVDALLRSIGMDAAQLQLEVTESLAAQDESVQARLHELKALGLTLALDDFGTGYSSLASLHLLPVDTVKIDRSFVCQADTSQHHRVLIEATVRVAHSLGMATVAEGIETPAQAAVVRELQCDKGQGYIFSRPRTADGLVQWLRTPVDD